jgi:peptide methionine sulfoxide reductase msrA/msrB
MVRLLKAINVMFLLCLTYGCWANNEQSHDVPMTFSNSEMSTHQQTLTVGLGCFWGAEKRFSQLDGVIDVVSGYADGRGIAPTYQAIIQRENKFNPNNFAEVVQITFNALQISTEQLLKRFFEWHDPTQGNRQGNDIGTQYRSTILYVDEAQQRVAEKVKAEFQTKLSDAGFGVITTTIKPLDEFHPAESYHQDYLVKNPNGYCPDHSTGVRFDAAPHNDTAAPNNLALLKGKHIVVIDSEFCPYCEKLKKDVLNDYTGTILVHFR